MLFVLGYMDEDKDDRNIAFVLVTNMIKVEPRMQGTSLKAQLANFLEDPAVPPTTTTVSSAAVPLAATLPPAAAVLPLLLSLLLLLYLLLPLLYLLL